MPEIRYSDKKDIEVGKLIELYRASQYNYWWNEHNVRAMLNYSYIFLTAWSNDQLVGTITVISDGVNNAFIDDLLVHPSFRHQKIGITLLQKVLDKIKPLNLKFIQLIPIPGQESFFEKAGFRVIPKHQVMEISMLK